MSCRDGKGNSVGFVLTFQLLSLVDIGCSKCTDLSGHSVFSKQRY
jgi:hypothetical protein